MPYILVEDFKSGLDTRRTNVTSVPGSLVTLTNAHLTRGNRKAQAFVALAVAGRLEWNRSQWRRGGDLRLRISGIHDVAFARTPTNVNAIQLRHPGREASFQITAALKPLEYFADHY